MLELKCRLRKFKSRRFFSTQNIRATLIRLSGFLKLPSVIDFAQSCEPKVVIWYTFESEGGDNCVLFAIFYSLHIILISVVQGLSNAPNNNFTFDRFDNLLCRKNKRTRPEATATSRFGRGFTSGPYWIASQTAAQQCTPNETSNNPPSYSTTGCQSWSLARHACREKAFDKMD